MNEHELKRYKITTQNEINHLTSHVTELDSNIKIQKKTNLMKCY